jgi:hypothetical protein
MKKLLTAVITLLIFNTAFSQRLKKVDEFNFSTATKKEYKGYKNGFDVNKIITDFGVFELGNELIINQPSNPVNVNRNIYNGVKVSNSTIDFTYVGLGKYSAMGAMAMVKMSINDANTPITIERIRVYKPALGMPATIVVDFKRKDGKNMGLNKFGNIFNLERAVNLGEIFNPNAPLTREEAIAKLKEAKDLVELEMMSKEDFEALKTELTPIIMGK